MTDPNLEVDTLVHAGWIIPVIPRDTVLEDHVIGVTDGKISHLLPAAEARSLRAQDEFHLPDHALIPGLINAHGHAAMSLLRGYADDLPLNAWLQERIWPVEGRVMGEDFVRAGTELAIAEMLKAGTTCFSDMYFFPNVVAQLCQQTGIRAQLTFPVIDFPTAWASDGDDYISKGLALRDDYKHNNRVSVVFGPHAAYTVCEANLQRVSTLAAELDLPIQIHLHETQDEVDNFVGEHGERPLERLTRLGLLGPKTQCVHMTALSDEDIGHLANTGAHVIHCPQSNMKLASGVCPVDKLSQRGINVALGTDGAASNNDLNLFGEMQAAALLAKVHSQQAASVTAMNALEMATLGGARALNMEACIGSLEPGKEADLTAVDLGRIETQPLYDPISQLVYACNGSQVTDVWVAGEQLLAQGELTGISEQQVLSQTLSWRDKIINSASADQSPA